jgi:hypothetical protein
MLQRLGLSDIGRGELSQVFLNILLQRLNRVVLVVIVGFSALTVLLGFHLVAKEKQWSAMLR